MLNWQGYGTDEAWALELFSERTGLPLARILPALRQAWERELLYPLDHGRLQTTALGQRFLNDLVGLFLND